jgi:alkylation response protein AidB-like acyl-CoA dehydrogenase
VTPEHAHVELGDGTWATIRLADVSAYARRMRTRLEAFVAAPEPIRPVPCADCPLCRWRAQCTVRLADEDSLFRVANVTHGQVAKLEAARVRTMAALAARTAPMGAFEHALAYAKRRKQFGKPLGAFQLVQNQLVQMLAGVTTSLTLCARLSELDAKGEGTEEQASLAEAYCTTSARQTVGLARELLGGKGILLEEQVGRFVADAEAIYSYEGTREINTLIVGRGLMGIGAFV